MHSFLWLSTVIPNLSTVIPKLSPILNQSAKNTSPQFLLAFTIRNWGLYAAVSLPNLTTYINE
jgi:hypothetical protein